MLDEAGWVMGADGVRRARRHAADGQPALDRLRELGPLQPDHPGAVADVGIDSEISTLEWNAYLDQWRENQGGWNVTYHQQGTQVAATAAIEAGWHPG